MLKLPWEQHKISQIADRFDNLRVPVTASKRQKGSTPYYGANGIQDYVNGYTHDGEFLLIAEDGANDIRNYPVNYVNGKVWVNNHAHVIKGKANIANNLFLQYAFKSINIESYLVGGGRAKLTAEVMMRLPIKLPSIEEQNKIGKLVHSLDDTITLHEEKQRQLEQLKKALLQKMFADKKEYPELRFNGFSDSWNKNKVSELFTITRGYVLPAKDTKPTPEGDYCYPVYSSQTAQNGLMGYYNKYLYKDAITWTTDGANAGTVRFRTGKFYCTNVCGVLLTKKAKASEMIAMALNKVTKKYVSYVGNPKLMNNVMGEIVISLPTNTEEQNNLSFLFNNLERAIILTEHKIEQLKSLKQALLQQMFI
ncbi:restriction endonuclease subunit S [Lactobacillus equicursoris]|uniref:restriction endonuclease subunit S n=1 Tax=Lactobacillus equicursoris TaxID=420645 RepID=UPI0039933BA9